MNDVFKARPPKIVIVLSLLPNWSKICYQSINWIKIDHHLSEHIPDNLELLYDGLQSRQFSHED